LFNDKALNSPETATLEASLVAGTPCALITFTTSDVEKVGGDRRGTGKDVGDKEDGGRLGAWGAYRRQRASWWA
jgi:hypothetical protein